MNERVNDLLRGLAYVLILGFLFGGWIALAYLPKDYQWHVAAVAIAGGGGSFALIHWFTDWRHGR